MVYQKSLDKKNLESKAFHLKMQYVFLPFLGVSVGVILFYNITRWIVGIYLDLWPLKDTVWNLIFPIIISVMVVFIVMKPRVKLLRFGKNDASIFYILLILVLFPSLAMSHAYVEKVAYNVVNIKDINDIQRHPKQKFFRVTNSFFDKKEAVSHVSTRLIGKYNDKFRVYLYLATPFSNAENIWLGQRFRMVFDNDMSREDKIQKIDTFIDDSLELYLQSKLSTESYFEKLQNSDTRHGYLEAIELSNQRFTGEPIIVIAKTGTLKEEAKQDLVRFFITFIIGIAVFFLMILKAKINEKELKKFRLR